MYNLVMIELKFRLKNNEMPDKCTGINKNGLSIDFIHVRLAGGKITEYPTLS